MNPDGTAATPAEPAPQEQAQPTEQQQPQAPAEPQAQAPEAAAPAPQTQTETVPVETAPASSSTSEVQEEAPEYPQAAPIAPIDINSLPRDPNNPEYVDNNALLGALQNQAVTVAREQARNEFAQQRIEDKLWDAAMAAHPQLKDNADLRDLVHNSRMGEIQTQLASGKQPKPSTPKQIADKLFKEINNAQASGYNQAQTNAEVQQGAHLESSSVTNQATAPANVGQQLDDLSSSSNKHDKVSQLLKGMFDRGDLKI